jgi:hypothetical protein
MDVLSEAVQPLEAHMSKARLSLETVTGDQIEAMRRKRYRIEIRNCALCKEAFQPHRYDQRFCCPTHRSYWHYLARTVLAQSVKESLDSAPDSEA